MADIQITRPQAGQRVTLENVENARLVLAFPPADVTLERVGDNLVFKFEDGGQVELPGFYTTYTSENLPAFQVEGAEISGKDFFAALGEDLMPAAGPAAPAMAPAGGRYSELGNDSLMSGVDRLDGLDLSFESGAAPADNTLNGSGAQGTLDGTQVAATAGQTPTTPTIPGTPTTPGTPEVPENPEVPGQPEEPVEPEQPVDPEEPEQPVDPEEPEQPVDPEEPEQPVDPEEPEQPVDPEEPEQPVDPEEPEQPVDPEEPEQPEAPDFSGLNLGTVYEGALQGGTGKNPHDSGEQGGQGSLTPKDTSTPLGGLPAGWEVVSGGNAYGTLVQDPATGQWNYVLHSASQEHSADSAHDAATGKVDVVLRDASGNTVTVQVDVTVVDDAPVATADSADVTEGGSTHGNVLDNDLSGADKWPTDSEGNIKAVTKVTAPEGWTELGTVDGSFMFSSSAGMITVYPDGSYDFLSSGDGTSSNTSFDFTYTVQDKDGDLAEGNLTINVKDVNLDQVVGGDVADRVVVDESALGSDKGALSEVKEFTLPEGVTFDPDKVSFNEQNVATVTTPNGTFTITQLGNGQYQYVYELNKSVDHDAPGGAADALKPGADSVTLPVTDGKGNTGDVTLSVDVQDDTPDGGQGNFFATKQPDGSYKAEGTLLLDFGADGAAEGGAALSLNDWVLKSSDGDTWVYTHPTDDDIVITLIRPDSGNAWNVTISAPSENSLNAAFREPVTGTVQDGDGDNGGLSLGVTVDKDVTLGSDSDLKLETSDADVGKGEAATDKGSLSFSAPDGFASISIGEVQLTWNDTGWLNAAGETVTQIEGGSGFLTLGTLTGTTAGGYTVDYTYTQDKGFTGHSQPGAGEVQEKADSFDVVITDKDGSKAEAEITVDISDDAPKLTVSVGQTVGGSGNNLKPFDDLNFQDFKSDLYPDANAVDPNTGKQYWQGPSLTLGSDGNTITVTAGTVHYVNGQVSGVDYGPESGKLLGMGYYNNNKDDRQGLTVGGKNNIHAEIGAGKNSAEAVVFDLGGKLAYGFDLTLGCFYKKGSGTDDANSEIARISFYRGDELIYSVDITSDKNSGVLNAKDAFQEYIRGGFDKVIVSPVNPGSDFVIREVGFETLPNADPLAITSGNAKGESGGDGYADGFENAAFNYTDGQTMRLVDENGKEFDVTLTVLKGTSGGDGMITALDADGNPVFSALMDKNGNWTFNQYKNFSSVDGGADGDKDTFDLSFITKDKDGDIAIGSAPIDTTGGFGEVIPPSVDANDSYRVVYGKDHINQVMGSDGVHDNPGGNSPIKDMYDAGEGHDRLVIQGGKGNILTVDSEGNIILPGSPNDNGADSVTFKNFEEVAGKSKNDKYELHLDDNQLYSVDDKGNVTLHFDDGKTIVFGCIEKGGIEGGIQMPYMAEADTFSLQADEGDALIFGNLSSYDEGHAAAQTMDFTSLEDDRENMDVLLSGVQDLGAEALPMQGAGPLLAAEPVTGLTQMDDLYNQLGIAQNSDGTPDLGSPQFNADWQVADVSESMTGANAHDDISLMVQENLIKSDSGAA